MTKRPKLVLIDGKALFHRAYHAIQHLTNAEGLPTNAVYGFVQMVLKAYTDLKPDYVILTWDKAKTSLTQRVALYPAYKAKRLQMPEDFYAQIPPVHEFARAMGVPLAELDHYEADDLIGTIIKQAQPNLDIIVVTNDRDTFQLLDNHPHVELYMQRRGMTETEIYDAARVMERYGIKPDQIIDLKALAGDASDNIPGVTGVGEKTALSLLQQYGTLDGIYDHLDAIPGKLQERLRDGQKIAYTSQKLATIMTDAPYQLDLESARTGHYDREALHELFRRLSFKSLLTKLPPELAGGGLAPSLFDPVEVAAPAKPRQHLQNTKYTAITDWKELDRVIKEMARQPVIAIDTETDSLDTLTAKLVGVSVAWKEGEAYYIPVGHTQGTQLDCQGVVDRLKPVLENSKIGKVGHNIKFDYQILRRYGVRLGPIAGDTMIAAFLVNPLGRAQSLDDLAYSEFGIEMIPITELIGQGKNQATFDSVLIETATQYAGEDADLAWRLYRRLEPQMKDGGVQELAERTEWPLIPILGDMELAGIKLDSQFLHDYNLKISKTITALNLKICELAGEQFNISSPAQLAQILYTKLGLGGAGIKRGKTGMSTAASELEKLRGAHPIIDHLFEYRELVKLKTTYVDALPRLVAADGRLHTSFNQTIAQTGRLSSTNPNLQNIPVRTEVGREIRRAFVAERGQRLIAGDYSQIELRVAAALSGDEAMRVTFEKGVDLHLQTAAELYDVPLKQVTKEQRYAAKTINFGVLYGMSAHGLAVATGLSREEAAGFIERYFAVRPKLKEYIEATKQFAREHEYTATQLGRRRPCPEINSRNHVLAAATERMAVNVPIQGTAADIYKLAMIALDGRLDDDCKLLLQIHDELIVEAPVAKAERVAKVMKETMEGAYDLGVPLAVETAIGRNWGEI